MNRTIYDRAAASRRWCVAGPTRQTLTLWEAVRRTRPTRCRGLERRAPESTDWTAVDDSPRCTRGGRCGSRRIARHRRLQKPQGAIIASFAATTRAEGWATTTVDPGPRGLTGRSLTR